MNADDQASAAEREFKQDLLAIGLLSEITLPLDLTARRQERQPAPVRVIRERR